MKDSRLTIPLLEQPLIDQGTVLKIYSLAAPNTRHNFTPVSLDQFEFGTVKLKVKVHRPLFYLLDRRRPYSFSRYRNSLMLTAYPNSLTRKLP